MKRTIDLTELEDLTHDLEPVKKMVKTEEKKPNVPLTTILPYLCPTSPLYQMIQDGLTEKQIIKKSKEFDEVNHLTKRDLGNIKKYIKYDDELKVKKQKGLLRLLDLCHFYQMPTIAMYLYNNYYRVIFEFDACEIMRNALGYTFSADGLRSHLFTITSVDEKCLKIIKQVHQVIQEQGHFKKELKEFIGLLFDNKCKMSPEIYKECIDLLPDFYLKNRHVKIPPKPYLVELLRKQKFLFDFPNYKLTWEVIRELFQNNIIPRRFKPLSHLNVEELVELYDIMVDKQIMLFLLSEDTVKFLGVTSILEKNGVKIEYQKIVSRFNNFELALELQLKYGFPIGLINDKAMYIAVKYDTLKRFREVAHRLNDNQRTTILHRLLFVYRNSCYTETEKKKCLELLNFILDASEKIVTHILKPGIICAHISNYSGAEGKFVYKAMRKIDAPDYDNESN